MYGTVRLSVSLVVVRRISSFHRIFDLGDAQYSIVSAPVYDFAGMRRLLCFGSGYFRLSKSQWQQKPCKRERDRLLVSIPESSRGLIFCPHSLHHTANDSPPRSYTLYPYRRIL